MTRWTDNDNDNYTAGARHYGEFFLYFFYTYYSNIYVQVIYMMMMKNRPNEGQIVPQGLETC